MSGQSQVCNENCRLRLRPSLRAIGSCSGFDKPVTLELWRLRQDGRQQQILDVSAKGKAITDAETQLLARQFFASARAAGLGEPGGQTKTQLVMDFYSTQR